MIIRQIKSSDAENFIHLTGQVERESDYMLLEADERKITPEQQRQKIAAIEEDDNSTILVAEKENRLIGFLVGIGGNARRNKHAVYIVTGILNDYRWQGVGTKLFEALEIWAKEHQIHRLELTVVTHNEAGLALYKKMGFKIEGTKRHSLYIHGEYADEYYMSRIL